MTDNRIINIASLTVVASGILWGFYWLPVRALEEQGLSGAWGTVAITLAALLVTAPVVLLRGVRLRYSSRAGLCWIMLGGAAFALYSIGFVYGRVAIIILLFFLTPVWSTLIARFVMGWHTPVLRLFAIALGLIGLGIMLGADGQLSWPRSVGEWLALISGLMWSVATTGMRVTPAPAPPETVFVFAFGACAASLMLAFVLAPWPGAELTGALAGIAALALGTGAVWWGIFMAALMWATVRLEPARMGILLMSEVLVGAASAAWFAGEYLSPAELTGGALVLVAGVLEVWPVQRAGTNGPHGAKDGRFPQS